MRYKLGYSGEFDAYYNADTREWLSECNDECCNDRPLTHYYIKHDPCEYGHSFVWTSTNTSDGIPNGLPCECGDVIHRGGK